ncbi:glycosyltransferase family 25 protein [Proteus vulgaris]|uniref:glycosyltransferase family 25 protein n=1 Tax=Proteus vulgaris TaxID=585 RepID=UPI00065A154A|nr:glycosyltransferase family 25 protein [Proteus vulgaris]CRL65450.1 Glycosyltransferase family 25 (LPS biosynthesis protein) [Proteus vulgaris]
MSKIPIYVVSIKDSLRKKNIEQELRNYNFSYIDAVVGSDQNKDYINNINNQKWVKKRYKRKLALGEIGCSLSHKKIYQKIIEDDTEWAIILEDDINLRKDIESLLIINNELLNKDTLYILGAQQHLDSEDMIITLKKNSLRIDKNIIFYDTFLSSKYIYRTAAYLIHKEVAKKILTFTSQKFCVADDWYIFHKYKNV